MNVNFLITKMKEELQLFLNSLRTRFFVGKATTGCTYEFSGCENIMEYSRIRLSMQKYWNRENEIDVGRARRKISIEKVTAKELLQYRSLVETRSYFGNGVLPQAALIVSPMHQKVPNLTKKDLVNANVMSGEWQNLRPQVVYKYTDNI